MSRLAWSVSVVLTLLVSVYAGVLLVHSPLENEHASARATTSTAVLVVAQNQYSPLLLPFFQETEVGSATNSAIEENKLAGEKPKLPVEDSSMTSQSKAPPAKSPQKPKVVEQTRPKEVVAVASTPGQGKTQTATSPEVQEKEATSTTSVETTDIASSGSSSLDVSARTLRDALVNIICYAPVGGKLHSISGSGIFVDTKGIILTNAHIAQYFLLKDRGVSCIIRSGTPAKDAYRADLMYIPSDWVSKNSAVVTTKNPSGTGEQDFALLGVTQSVSGALPASFPFVSLSRVAPVSGTPVVIASFGAQFLDSAQIQNALFPTIVFGAVNEVFTFALNSIDVIDLGGSVAAQEGSSGGGVANASGELVGTITTSTTEGATDSRVLSAITASYIRSEYTRETQNTLDAFLQIPVSSSIESFKPKIVPLEALITAHLN